MLNLYIFLLIFVFIVLPTIVFDAYKDSGNIAIIEPDYNSKSINNMMLLVKTYKLCFYA